MGWKVEVSEPARGNSQVYLMKRLQVRHGVKTYFRLGRPESPWRAHLSKWERRLPGNNLTQQHRAALENPDDFSVHAFSGQQTWLPA